MLLDEINETHTGTYDFFYLPIDFKNRCNVGYAFMNFIDFRDIVSFYHKYNGQKWRLFNSEKVRRPGLAISPPSRRQASFTLLTCFGSSMATDLPTVLRPHPGQGLAGDPVPEF